MKVLAATNLGHIDEKINQLDKSAFSQHCVDWSFAVVKIEACIDVSAPSATVKVILAGTQIGGCTLSPQHQKCKIGGSIAGFKAEVTLSLDGDCLKADVEVCAPIVGCERIEHDIFCW